MSDATERRGEGLPDPEALLRELDPELNIFALANGLDLDRNVSGHADRVLTWYREGMERFLRIVAEPGGDVLYAFRAEAVHTREGRSQRAFAELGSGLTGEELRRRLRTLLNEGVERANGLGPEDLRPDHDTERMP